jgi:hypothetical protein
VLRLVDAERPTARERKPGDRSPALLVDGRALQLLRLHLGDERMDVAHQEEFVCVVLVTDSCFSTFWKNARSASESLL